MIVVMVRMLVASEEEAEGLVARFRNRAGMVDKQPGFIGFELLKGEGECVSMTRWANRESLDAWMGSQAHAQAHTGAPPPTGAGHWRSEGEGQQHGQQRPPQSGRGGPMQGNVSIYEVAVPREEQS